MGDIALRDKIDALAESMEGLDPDFDAEVHHHFGFQTYVREMRLNKNDVVVGKLHRYPCVNILSKGTVIVEGEFESDTYVAPRTWVSVAGTRRAIACIEDCVWATVHQNPTDTRDMAELESYLIADSYAALELV